MTAIEAMVERFTNITIEDLFKRNTQYEDMNHYILRKYLSNKVYCIFTDSNGTPEYYIMDRPRGLQITTRRKIANYIARQTRYTADEVEAMIESEGCEELNELTDRKFCYVGGDNFISVLKGDN